MIAKKNNQFSRITVILFFLIFPALWCTSCEDGSRDLTASDNDRVNSQTENISTHDLSPRSLLIFYDGSGVDKKVIAEIHKKTGGKVCMILHEDLKDRGNVESEYNVEYLTVFTDEMDKLRSLVKNHELILIADKSDQGEVSDQVRSLSDDMDIGHINISPFWFSKDTMPEYEIEFASEYSSWNIVPGLNITEDMLADFENLSGIIDGWITTANTEHD